MPHLVSAAGSRRHSPKQTAMLIAVLQHYSCLWRNPPYQMVRRASMWAVGDSPHHKVDGEHLLGLGLLVLDETPDAGGRNGIWGTPSATFREQLPGSGSSRSPGCRSRRLSRSTAWP